MHRAWCCLKEAPYCFWMSFVKFQGHTAQEIVDFDPNWAFPDCNSSLNSPTGTKCCTKLEVAWKRCPIVFQGHPSNFKVTGVKKLPILTWIERFRTVTSVWIYPWLWNDAQSLMYYRRGALLFFKVIHPIARSHGTKKSQILTRIERFRTVTSVLNHRWIWNDAQSLMWYRRGALLFFDVIHQISRSHGLKNRWFG